MIKNEKKLIIVKEGEFLGRKCDFYKDENDSIFMTREQVRTALKYKNLSDAIYRIYKRNKDRLDKFSVTVKLSNTDQREYNTNLYSERGIYEICKVSRQPVANDFYDWVYDQIELIRRNGGAIQEEREKEFVDGYFPSLLETQK